MRPLYALAALALTVACGGNTPTSPSLESGLAMLTKGTVRATVDGFPWESVGASAFVGTAFPGTPPVIGITAVSASRLGLTIDSQAAEGTHEVRGPGYVAFRLSQDLTNSWSASVASSGSSGTLTITRATPTRITGTFSFLAATPTQGLLPATRTVTNGTFDLSQ